MANTASYLALVSFYVVRNHILILERRHLVDLRIWLLGNLATAKCDMLLDKRSIGILNWLLVDKLWLRHHYRLTHLIGLRLGWTK